ncbi:MAG: hypothetical protein U0P81_10000 [Holophagaceae bacterium]
MKPLLSTLALALLASPVFAQDKPDTEKRVADLERKLEILSRELEAQKSGTTAPQAAEAGRFGLAPAASKVYDTPGGLSVGGYGELVYENFENRLQNGERSPRSPNADNLRLILYTGYKFSDRIVFNSELEFEHGGYSDEHVEGEVKVEFAYFDFLWRKELNVRAGQVLMPLGFINEIHEPPTVLSVKRPFTERAIIPATWSEIGVGVHGELPAGLSYRAYLTTGLQATHREEGLTEGFDDGGIRGGRQGGKEAFARSLALSGRLDWSPMPGFLFGASFFTGNSGTNTEAGEGPRITTTVMDLHGELRLRGWQVRALWARFTNSATGVDQLDPTDPARHVGTKAGGAYLEAGYDVLNGRSGKQALIPFLRLERVDTQKSVMAGVDADPANDQKITTVGLSWKPLPQVAVKADVMKVTNGARTGRNQFNLALGYYF